MIIDTHAHLMAMEFEAEIGAFLDRAESAGVGKIVNVGFSAETNVKSLEMAAKYPQLYATLGLHPYDAEEMSDNPFVEWRDLIISNEKIVALGETGLDYFKSPVARDIQRASFVEHLKLAHEVGLPVIVHNRDSDDDAYDILKDFVKDGVKAVFHCYGSTLEYAQKLWAMGIYTSFTGIVTYPGAAGLREVVSAVPENLWMVETDCPYLAPQGRRGSVNEPSYLTEVVEKIAEIQQVSPEDVKNVSTRNALEFFARMN